MIPPLRLLARREVGLQLLLRREERAVDALEHRPVLVAAPVSARDMGQFECTELARALGVPSSAEILELTVAEVADGWVFDVVDQFELVRLTGEDAARLVLRDLLSDDGKISLDRDTHPLLQRLKVVRCEWPWQVEVVVEAVFDRRSDRILRLREHLQYRFRQHVRR